MRIFIDLDNTLVDTSSFKHVFKHALTPLGVDPELFDKTKIAASGESWYQPYDFDRHIDLLLQAKPRLDRQEVRQRILEAYAGIKNFLFPDAIPFLEEVEKQSNVESILFTFGHTEIQMVKIHSLGLEKYFGKIEITDKHKKYHFSKFHDRELANSIYINDNVKECLEINEQLPELKMIIRKISTPQPPHPFPVVTNLLEINKLKLW